MELIFIYGLPATGKLTVAKELSKSTGYKLFHNHLVVDLLLSVFEFGSQPFVQIREEIWLSVFEQACQSQLPGLIFTFNPENTVRPTFVDAAINTIAKHGGRIHFVELVCPIAELRDRIDSPSRLEHKKLSSLALFEKLHADGVFDTAHMPKPIVTVNTSSCNPMEAAAMIVDKLTEQASASGQSQEVPAQDNASVRP